jgi:prepilin-type N-terminal cleavage/methylation domain-containing protein
MSSRPTAADNSRNRGFVLIEVLVAVAVAAIIMAVLIRSFATTWSGIGAVREEAEAMLLARAMLEHEPLSRKLTPGVKTGTIGVYAWTVTTAKASVAAPLKDPNDEQPVTPWALYRVVVVMSAPSGRSTTLETFQLAQTPR